MLMSSPFCNLFLILVYIYHKHYRYEIKLREQQESLRNQRKLQVSCQFILELSFKDHNCNIQLMATKICLVDD